MEPHARKDEIEDCDDDGLVQEIDPDGMAAEEKQGLEGFLPQEGQAAFLLFRIESLSEGDADEDDAEIGEDRPPVDAVPVIAQGRIEEGERIDLEPFKERAADITDGPGRSDESRPEKQAEKIDEDSDAEA